MGLLKALQYAILPLRLAGLVLTNCVMTFVPMLFPKMGVKLHKQFMEILEIDETNKRMSFVAEGVGDFRYFWQRMKVFIDGAVNEVTMVAEEKGKAPNPSLRRLTDKSECRLLDLSRTGRPLVINFGSCT